MLTTHPTPAPLAPTDLDARAQRALYKQMVLIRRFEEKAGQLYGLGQIGGYCHLYVGQEAIVTGLQSVAHKGDATITGYRDHAHALAAGCPPGAVMAELMGRETGLCGGRAGSMHLADPGRGFYGGHAMPGAQVSIGLGLALAARRRRAGGAVFVYFGDGTAAHGAVAEAIGTARTLALPIVFVIENNAEETDTTDTAPLTRHATTLGLPAQAVDGSDVLTVRAAGMSALSSVRAGAGPALIEAKTIRHRGHALAHRRNDPQEDRARKARDCLARMRAHLIARDLAQESALDALELAARSAVAGAVDAASAAQPAGHQASA